MSPEFAPYIFKWVRNKIEAVPCHAGQVYSEEEHSLCTVCPIHCTSGGKLLLAISSSKSSKQHFYKRQPLHKTLLYNHIKNPEVDLQEKTLHTAFLNPCLMSS